MLSKYLREEFKKRGFDDIYAKHTSDEIALKYLNGEINKDWLILETLKYALNKELEEIQKENEEYEKLLNVNLN